MSNDIIEFVCPHCGLIFIVDSKETNCRIIRHFVFYNGEQLNPHSSREECKKVLNGNLGYGCAGPVYLSYKDGVWKALPCDYI